MNDKVLQDLYNRAISKGYSKTIEDFSVLLEENETVFNDNFNYVTSKGYTKGKDEFSTLVGLKKKDVSEVSTSGLEPGVSVSGETDDIFKNDYLLGIRDGSIKKDSGQVFTTGEVISAAKEQGYSQEDIDSMMVKTSSDPITPIEVTEEPKVEEPEPEVIEEPIVEPIVYSCPRPDRSVDFGSFISKIPFSRDTRFSVAFDIQNQEIVNVEFSKRLNSKLTKAVVKKEFTERVKF